MESTEVEAALALIDPARQALARHLWVAVPVDGSPIGNRSLRRVTKTFTNPDYTSARNALRDVGLVQLGGGRSGSVFRVVADPTAVAPASSAGFELSLYASIVPRLEQMTIDDSRFDARPVVCRTGLQGRKKTGGAWTRPDITVVAFKKFRVLTGGHLEVHTYEVKTGAGFDVTALHEARSHRRNAHRSYVLVDIDADKDVARIEALIDEARDLGVGLISFRSVDDEWATWYEPPIHLPDPIELDDFLATQLPEDAIAAIRSWGATPALGGTSGSLASPLAGGAA